MSIYQQLENVVHDTESLTQCNTARGPWEYRKNGPSMDIKFNGKFIVLHNPTVSRFPTVCREVISDNELDYNLIASIVSLA